MKANLLCISVTASVMPGGDSTAEFEISNTGTGVAVAPNASGPARITLTVSSQNLSFKQGETYPFDLGEGSTGPVQDLETRPTTPSTPQPPPSTPSTPQY